LKGGKVRERLPPLMMLLGYFTGLLIDNSTQERQADLIVCFRSSMWAMYSLIIQYSVQCMIKKCRHLTCGSTSLKVPDPTSIPNFSQDSGLLCCSRQGGGLDMKGMDTPLSFYHVQNYIKLSATEKKHEVELKSHLQKLLNGLCRLTAVCIIL